MRRESVETFMSQRCASLQKLEKEMKKKVKKSVITSLQLCSLSENLNTIKSTS